jgi:hypothetical protein
MPRANRCAGVDGPGVDLVEERELAPQRTAGVTKRADVGYAGRGEQTIKLVAKDRLLGDEDRTGDGDPIEIEQSSIGRGASHARPEIMRNYRSMEYHASLRAKVLAGEKALIESYEADVQRELMLVDDAASYLAAVMSTVGERTGKVEPRSCTRAGHQ